MKKSILTLPFILSLSFFLFPTHAFTQDIGTAFVPFINYVGIDVTYASLDHRKTDSINTSDYYEKNPLGGRFYFGNHGQHFGIEIGIQLLSGTRKNVPAIPSDTTFTLGSLTLDGLLYYPISNLELVGSLGVAATYTKDQTSEISSNPLIKNIDKTEILQPRIGFGSQYILTENLKIRTMFHWQNLNADNLFNHLITFNFGFNYSL